MRRFSFVLGLWAIGCGGSGDGTEGSSSTGSPGTGTGSSGIPTTGDASVASTDSGEPGTTGGTSTGATTAVTTEGGESTTGTVLPPMSLEDVVDGEAELLQDGLNFPEGPVWDVAGDYLLFSDIGASTIWKWTERFGVEPFILPSDMSNGLDFDGMGRLLAAEHATRRISRREVGEDLASSVVDSFEGQKLNSPNDLVWRSDGSIYFTDPPYGIDPGDQELDFQGVFWIDPQGALVVLADDFDRPNGIVLSPDESTLYVDDTAKEHVRVFDIQPDGNAIGGEVFVDLKSDAVGDPDGMTVDEFGDLYVTGGGGVRVVTPAGAVLGTIAVPEAATNCTFGDADGRALFITAPPRLYRVRMKVKGVGF